MKVRAVVVLLAIVFSILSPLSLHLVSAHERASIQGLDLCHAGSLALSPGHDAPCVTEPLFVPSRPLPAAAAAVPDPKPSLQAAVFQEELPPKA